MSTAPFVYQGAELELFARAENWKRYWAAMIEPYLGKRVLEVGAGTGTNTPYLNKGGREWVCLEPDADLAAAIAARPPLRGAADVRVLAGTIDDVPERPGFDSIVYIDVLEHIEDDRAQMAAAAARLSPGGTLIVLSPAHGWLYSPLDVAVGHFRRYSARNLRALTQPELELVSLRHLDSIGVLASLMNRFVLRPSLPTVGQILVWDRMMVPLSRLIDPLFFYRVGKSIIAVWRREEAAREGCTARSR